MTLVPSSLIGSAIPVKTNAVKNILFHSSELALQYALLQFLSYATYLTGEYTSFVMFNEGFIQKYLFIKSQGVRRSGIIIVLIFFILFMLTSLYDTMLWALDSPGYVVLSKVVNGSAVTPFLLQRPSYVTVIDDPDKNPARINIDESLTSNLFTSGFNASFPSYSYLRTPNVTVGPRGSSMTFGDDLLLSFHQSYLLNDEDCITTREEKTSFLDNMICSGGFDFDALQSLPPVGLPTILFRSGTAIVSPREDNPWATLSSEPITAIMKQVFTVTNGKRRHTFLQTTLKFSLSSNNSAHTQRTEVEAMFHRALALFYNKPTNTNVYVDQFMDVLHLNQVAMMDVRVAFHQNTTHPIITLVNIAQARFWPHIRPEYGYTWGLPRTARGPSDTTGEIGRVYMTFTNIEPIRTETIYVPAQPSIPCRHDNYDISTGGRVRYNSCQDLTDSEFGSISQNPHFLGRIDTSAVIIILNVLGDGASSKNTIAFNMTGGEWYKANRNRIDQLLLSRAFLLSGNADSVQVAVYYHEPALSYLQLLLATLPLVLALISFVLMLQDKEGYYSHSLFAALVTETLAGPNSRRLINYIVDPPMLVPRNLKFTLKNGLILRGSPELSEEGHGQGDGVGVALLPKSSP